MPAPAASPDCCYVERVQMLFLLAALPLFSLAFVVFDKAADLRKDSADRTRAFEETWGTLYPLQELAMSREERR